MINARSWLVVGVMLAGVGSARAETPKRSKVVAPESAPAKKDDKPWGPPVSDPAEEKAVTDALAAIADGGKRSRAVLGNVVVIGPALWASLTQLDPKVADLGTSSNAMIPSAAGLQTMPMRTFTDDAALEELVEVAVFQAVGKSMRGATVRPATSEERQLFYALIPFEIAGTPVTIVEKNQRRLLVLLQNKKVMWLDVISAYRSGKQPP